MILTAATVMVGYFSNNASAQGNFDPEAMRQRMMDRYREQIGVKSDEDWKKIEPLIAKVTEAQRAARMGLGAFGGGRGGRGGGANANQNANRPRIGGEPNPDVVALQKAIEDKAPAEEIQAKLAKVREARKEKEAALAQAQADLRKALSPRQEAGAVLAGLIT